jgi:hypothetical protein
MTSSFKATMKGWGKRMSEHASEVMRRAAAATHSESRDSQVR